MDPTGGNQVPDVDLVIDGDQPAGLLPLPIHLLHGQVLEVAQVGEPRYIGTGTSF